MLSLVDLFSGGGGAGFGQGQVFVGATVPFGMVKPGPDTTGPLLGDIGFAHTAGYWYPDDTIHGFSQLHLHGTGIEDYGNVLIMPVDGASDVKTNKRGYKQRFRHHTESASPGYYAVLLDSTGTRVELTASKHAALHRYGYADDTDVPGFIVDLGHGLGIDTTPDSEIVFDADRRTVRGWMVNAGRFTGERRSFKVYFSILVDAPMARWGVFEHGALKPGVASARGQAIGAFVELPKGTSQVELRVGMSFIDVAAAEANRQTIEGRTFESVLASAQQSWRAVLDRVSVEGGTDAEQRMFASALYRSYLLPSQLSESDGRYVGLDRAVHRAHGFDYLTDLSLWDTYRTVHPLFALLTPKAQRDVAQSLLVMATQHGALPRWPLGVNETGTMLGSPASIVLADTVLRGVGGIDPSTALDAMIADADGVEGRSIRGSIRHCLAAGYCPADRVGGSVARTLEYAWADFAISNVARHVANDTEADRFEQRSHMWTGHWDPQSQFLRGRMTDGSWSEATVDPFAWTDEFVEGNAWHYLWAVPFDIDLLQTQFGGAEPMLTKLDHFFNMSEQTPTPIVIEEGQFKGPDLYYWHGNEPDIHAAYMYALAGVPDRGAKWIDWVRRSKYSDAPDGLAGNDDAGTLSAWYVFSALGLYPLAGSDRYIVGTPLFDRATLRLDGGDLIITANNRTGGVQRVRKLTFNGTPVDTTTFTHAMIAGGGELVFELTGD